MAFDNSEVRFEIKDSLGTLSETSRGWKKQLNFVSWSGNDAKYDIREWSPDNQKMGKGVTLTKDELLKLKEILNGVEL